MVNGVVFCYAGNVMDTTHPLVFIILINWNNSKETLECLQSLESVLYVNFHVLVIDNASGDNSREHLDAWKPDYRYTVLQNRENKGFTGGNNTGIRYALAHSADYILLLNNDTIVDKHFLTYLVDDMEAHPKVGIAGPSIYFYDKPKVLWFNGGTISLGKFVGSIQHVDMGKKQKKDLAEDTGFITGCALMGRAQMWQEVGYFDQRFFLYFEDADINIRARGLGWGIRLVPNAKIWHKVSVTTLGQLGAPKILYYHYRNAHLLVKKHASLWVQAYIHLLSLLIAMKQVIKLATLIFPRKHSWLILRGILDYYIRRFGKL